MKQAEIIDNNKGRAALIRDPDVGGYPALAAC